jgi:hypothetical protein
MTILVRDVNQSKKWRTLEPQTFTDEEELKKLLVESPEILPLEDLEVSFVVSIPEFTLGSGAADVMMFGEQGNVAIIECKLDRNPEIKRKVIGQIVEYASYLWGRSYEQVDGYVREKQGRSLAALVKDKAQGIWDEESFRSGMRNSLERGVFSLIVAVDKINDELKRTVQYFNQSLKPEYSVYALKMRRFKQGNIEILIPHLYPEAPLIPATLQMTWQEFLKDLKENQPENVAEVVESLHSWAEKEEVIVTDFGKSSVLFYLRGLSPSLFSITTKGMLYLNYGWLLKPVGKDILKEFHNRHGIKVSEDFSKFPSKKVSELFVDQPEAIEKFKQAVIWLAGKVQKSSILERSE